MAHTRTHPLDYQKRIVIVSQLKRLCAKCGGNTACLPPTFDVLRCISCKSTDTVEVWEHMADTFRRGLMEREYEKALHLAAACAPQMDEFLQIIGEVLDTDATLVALEVVEYWNRAAQS
jgi:hypothetical protein